MVILYFFSFVNIRDSVSTGKNIPSISIYEKGKIFYFFTGLATGTGDAIEMGNLSILQHS